jgi:hypothetical protein
VRPAGSAYAETWRGPHKSTDQRPIPWSSSELRRGGVEEATTAGLPRPRRPAGSAEPSPHTPSGAHRPAGCQSASAPLLLRGARRAAGLPIAARAFFAEPLPLCHVGISKNIAPHSRSRSHPCTPSCRPANLVVVAGRPAGRRVRGCWLCAGPSVHGRDDVCWRKGWSARLLRGARQQLCGLELGTGVAMIHHRPPSSRRFGDRFPGPASSDA